MKAIEILKQFASLRGMELGIFRIKYDLKGCTHPELEEAIAELQATQEELIKKDELIDSLLKHKHIAEDKPDSLRGYCKSKLQEAKAISGFALSGQIKAIQDILNRLEGKKTMTRITFKTDGKKIPESILVDADIIKNESSLEATILDIFNETHNKCICCLNEGQAYCDCEGQYGGDVEIDEVINDSEAELKQAKDQEIAALKAQIKVKDEMFEVVKQQVLEQEEEITSFKAQIEAMKCCLNCTEQWCNSLPMKDNECVTTGFSKWQLKTKGEDKCHKKN